MNTDTNPQYKKISTIKLLINYEHISKMDGRNEIQLIYSNLEKKKRRQRSNKTIWLSLITDELTVSFDEWH